MAELEGPEQRRRRGFRLTAKYQVSGWRFLYRRLQHALVVPAEHGVVAALRARLHAALANLTENVSVDARPPEL